MDTNNFYDMIIVGGGPAGLSAAIYMARAKYKTLVIEKEKIGGQITITSEVVNYPGVFKTSGSDLTGDMYKQAVAFGAEFKMSEVLSMDLDGDIKTIKTTSGEFKTLGVILAVGASPRKLGFDGESDFAGRGVAYCATCDGEFFSDMPVYVVGGGFAAVEEGIFLTKYASNVEMIVREDDFTCAKTVSDHIYDQEKINVNFNMEVVSVTGDSSLKTITLKNNVTGEIIEKTHENGFGVFVFAGYVPNTKWLGDAVELKDGYIVTDEKKCTNIPGVYGAGDVCIKDLRQVVTAVSDGATAATVAEKHVSSIHSKLNLPAFEVTKQVVTESNHEVSNSNSNDDSFIDSETKSQLLGVIEKFENKITIQAVVSNSQLGNEMSGFIKELNGLSDKLFCTVIDSENDESFIEILNTDNSSSGIKYFAMPGGHEFNSFVLAMYNVAGPGQSLDSDIVSRINSINLKTDIKVLISLSCTMCPDVVVATQKMASLNQNISASAIDISQYPDLKEKYKVMSVPCMVINDQIVHFGKKNIQQILDIVEESK